MRIGFRLEGTGYFFCHYYKESRIAVTEQSLRNMHEEEDLVGKRFLDIGSGSGLFSVSHGRNRTLL